MDKNIEKLDNKVFKPKKVEKKEITHQMAWNYAKKYNVTVKQAFDLLNIDQ